MSKSLQRQPHPFAVDDYYSAGLPEKWPKSTPPMTTCSGRAA